MERLPSIGIPRSNSEQSHELPKKVDSAWGISYSATIGFNALKKKEIWGFAGRMTSFLSPDFKWEIRNCKIQIITSIQ
jgi:hypothetical protein